MRPGFGLFRNIGGFAAIGAVALIVGISAVAGVRAPAAQAFCSESPVRDGATTSGSCVPLDSCTVVTNTVLDHWNIDGDIGAESHLTCNDSRASIVSSQWLKKYIPSNNGWAIVGAWGATDHDGESYQENYIPCYAPVPAGSTRQYHVEVHYDVTFADGIHTQYNPTSNTRTISCEAVA